MEKFGTAFPQFVEPAGNQGFEFLPTRPIGMLSEPLTGELEPDLLHRLGPGSAAWQRQQANPAVSGRQVTGHIAMEMHGPIIQGDINHIGVRILLLDEVKKAVPLFDVEVIALANYDRPTGDIHAASQAAGL